MRLDETTICAAKDGREDAMAAVIACMMPQIRRGAAASVCPGLDYDDAVQEGLIALFRAVKSYDAGKNSRFETYASACVQNAQRSACRAAGRKKNEPLNLSVPLTEDTASPGPEELLMAEEACAEVQEWMARSLSPLERSAAALRLSGCGTEEIAERLGVSRKSAENALDRVRRKLKSFS